jgi:hypothetical protein
MQTKFAAALLVNELARDLLYLIERLPEDPGRLETETVYRTGIAPTLEEAATSIAKVLKVGGDRKPQGKEGLKPESRLGSSE